jgi:hypothetical protein
MKREIVRMIASGALVLVVAPGAGRPTLRHRIRASRPLDQYLMERLAARTVVPYTYFRTKLVLAGKSKAEIKESIKIAMGKRICPSRGRREVLHDVEKCISY